MPTELDVSVRPLHFIVVDDNRDAAEGLCVVVRLWGHQCRCAFDGATAYQLAVEHRPEVILSDLAMPDVDGIALARMIRRQHWGRQPLLIAVTGFADDEHRRRAFAAGFDQVFAKPLDPIELQSLLHQHFPSGDEDRQQ
jgi:CheY-like chemotaxis protein